MFARTAPLGKLEIISESLPYLKGAQVTKIMSTLSNPVVRPQTNAQTASGPEGFCPSWFGIRDGALKRKQSISEASAPTDIGKHNGV